MRGAGEQEVRKEESREQGSGNKQQQVSGDILALTTRMQHLTGEECEKRMCERRGEQGASGEDGRVFMFT